MRWEIVCKTSSRKKEKLINIAYTHGFVGSLLCRPNIQHVTNDSTATPKIMNLLSRAMMRTRSCWGPELTFGGMFFVTLLIAAALSALGAIVRYFIPSLMKYAPKWWPVAAPTPRKVTKTAGLRVAVIGGGIGGVGCAYALQQAGAHVTLFESRDSVGGNAKTWDWAASDGAGTVATVRTGLSVLAWPQKYFHNYNALLSVLGIATQQVCLPFAIRLSGDAGFTYLQDDTASATRFATDLKAWKDVVRFIGAASFLFSSCSKVVAVLSRCCCACLCLRRGRLAPSLATDAPSVYTFHALSPLNVISLRRLCLLFGMRKSFWDTVAMPIWSSTFLSGESGLRPSTPLGHRVRHSVAMYGQLLLFCDQSMREKAWRSRKRGV